MSGSMLPLDYSVEALIASTVDGNYTYKAYASNDSGSNYSTTYTEGVHAYVAIKTSEIEIENPIVSDFAGLWVPIKEHTYRAYASDDSGSDYSTTYNSSVHSYEAVITSNDILTPVVGDFSGKWIPFQKVYTYVAYADNNEGFNFTTTFDEDKLYFAILVTSTEKTPVLSDFAGLWRPMSRKGNVFDYNEFTLMDDIEMQGTPNAFGANQLGPAAIHYKGDHNRIYFSWYNTYKDWINQVKSGEESGHWISYVDCDSGVVSTPVMLPMTYNHSIDTHSLPAINVSDDGYLILMYEVLGADDNPSAHNSPIDIWRSNSPEIIENPSSPGSHYFTKVSTISGNHSYPHIVKDPNGNMFSYFRSYVGSYHKWLSGIKSTDGGVNWTNLEGSSPNTSTYVAEYDGPGTGIKWFLYSLMVEGAQEFGINLVLLANEGYDGATGPDGTAPNSNHKVMFFLHSDDGITWENVNSYLGTNGSFSQNILTSGHLDYSDLITNFKVTDVLTDVNKSIAFQWAYLDDENGIPYILYGTITRDDNGQYSDELESLNLTYFNTGTNSWSSTDYLSLKDIGTTVSTNNFGYTGSLSYFRAYSSTKWEMILSRVIPDTRFVTQHTPITSTSDLYAGAIARVAAKTTSFTGFSVGDKFIVYAEMSGGVPTGNFTILSTGEVIVLDSNNTLEILTRESIILRTDDAANNWTLINTFPNPENYTYGNARYSTGWGNESDYHLIMQYVSKLHPGASVACCGSGQLKLILGKRI